jgi:hypothetical protein
VLAVTRYQLALLGHSQRYAPAAGLYFVVMAIQYGDPRSPIMPEFSFSAGALLVTACWLTIALLDIEDPVQRLITLSHARRWRPILAGTVLAVLACAFVTTVISEAWAALVHHGTDTSTLLRGLVAHLTCALIGVAIGLPCSKLLVPRVGNTLLFAAVALCVVLLSSWLPLANPLLRAMAQEDALDAKLLVSGVSAVVLLAASTFVVGVVVHRRA